MFRVGYSVSQNMRNIIININKNKLFSFIKKNGNNMDANTIRESVRCNSWNKDLCKDKDNSYFEAEIVYKASVSTLYRVYEYAGSLLTTFKRTVANHLNTFRNRGPRNSTSLRKCIWKLRVENTRYGIGWKIIGRNRANRIGNDMCQLFNVELFSFLNLGIKLLIVG